MTNAAQANKHDSDTLDMHSPNLVDDNVQKIMALFPNCITESEDEYGNLKKAVDFDLLRQELSQSLVEGGQERYRLDWPGKRQAILEANSPIAKTLRPARDESVNFDTTENLFIEGDNLEALKLLQESYLGQVKMIYIDPPYNTGNDFIYEDDFSEDTADFLERSEQLDEEGNRLVTNAESNGRFHSDWLTMMYSRLKLARNLLKDDGIIFISIDENEQFNLHKICNEVFGQKNFVSCITRATGTPTGGGNNSFVNELDYVLVYAKDSSALNIEGFDLTKSEAKIYDQNDENGTYLTRPLRRTGGEDKREDRPSMYFPLTAPNGSEVYPIGPTGYESRWICGKKKYDEMLKNNLIEWKEIKDQWQVYQKFYLEGRKKLPGNLWDDIEGNKKATRDVRKIFNSLKVFDHPKPIGLIEKIVSCIEMEGDIILDFFAGSSTTAHSVMQLNSKDYMNRKFIMVQIDEPIDTDKQKDAYQFCIDNNLKPNIAEISKERIRRAGQKIVEDNQDKDGIENLDIGFRVFKIDSTNMKDVYYTPDEYLQADLDNLESHIKEDRTGEDLLFQVMLDWGVPLSLPIEVKEIQGSSVYYVGIDSLVACFDTLSTDLIDEISKDKPIKFVSSELAIAHDQDKTNIKARFAQLSPDTQVKFI